MEAQLVKDAEQGLQAVVLSLAETKQQLEAVAVVVASMTHGLPRFQALGQLIQTAIAAMDCFEDSSFGRGSSILVQRL